MQKTYLFLLLFAHIFTASAQRCLLNEKANSYIYSPKIDSFPAQGFLFIETNCTYMPKVTDKGNWNMYSFTCSQDDIARFSTKDTIIHLYINQKPFTGFLNLAENQFYMYLLQFNEGHFEAIDTLINEDRRNFDPPVKKPVLYLYPPQKQDIKVEIQLNEGTITHTYPAYHDAWQVVASPDGTLQNKSTGKSHYCLFWETEGKPLIEEISTGFVVKGTETAAFLEEKLAKLGLNEKEANEFIIFWLPQMEGNAYNLIHFAQEEYEKTSELHITPKPETQIRVMMVWKASPTHKALETQILPSTPIRKGFTVVEWGGTELFSAD